MLSRRSRWCVRCSCVTPVYSRTILTMPLITWADHLVTGAESFPWPPGHVGGVVPLTTWSRGRSRSLDHLVGVVPLTTWSRGRSRGHLVTSLLALALGSLDPSRQLPGWPRACLQQCRRHRHGGPLSHLIKLWRPTEGVVCGDTPHCHRGIVPHPRHHATVSS